MRGVRRTAFSGVIVLLLLVAAVLLGYLSDIALTEWDKIRYPTDFSDTVTACAGEFGLDEYTIYATIKVLSDFSSNCVSDDGKIGLMQLSEETFLWLTTSQLDENLDKGMLYEPKTNIRYGSYYLLYLTTRYDVWDAVFAAYLCGTEQVDIWYADWANSAQENMSEFVIQNEEIQKKVDKIQRTIDKYQELYKNKEMHDHESNESK